MSVIYRILNMSLHWHSSCEHTIVMSVINISSNSRIILISFINKIPFHGMSSVVMLRSLAIITLRIWMEANVSATQSVISCQSSNYTVTATYQDTCRFIYAICRVIHCSSILSENYSIIACCIQVRTVTLA